MREVRKLNGLMTGIVCLLVLTSTIFAGTGVVAGDAGQASEDSFPDGVDTQSPDGVEIDPELQGEFGTATADNDSTVELFVHLESFDHGTFEAKSGTTDNPEKRVKELQSHAKRSQASIRAYAAGVDGVSLEEQFWIINTVYLTVDTEKVNVRELARVDGVERIEPIPQYEIPDYDIEKPEAFANKSAGKAVSPQADNNSYDAAWNVKQINATEVWEEYDTMGEGVKVAVLDSGLDLSHPDLELYTDNESDPLYPGGWAEFYQGGRGKNWSQPYDDMGHGTLVSGLVAGGNSTGEYIGAAPGVDLMHAKVMEEEFNFLGGPSLVRAVQWSIANDADIVSMSLEGADGDTYINLMDNVREVGVLPVAGIGNDGEGTDGAPGRFYNTIGAGSSTESGSIGSHSGGRLINTTDVFGDEALDSWPDKYISVSIAAPGTDVTSSYVGGGYRVGTGTSFAAPHISAAAALMQSATDERFSPAELEKALEETAWKPDDWNESDAQSQYGDRDSRYGDGIIDTKAAIEYLKNELSDEPTVEQFEVTDNSANSEANLTVEWAVSEDSLSSTAVTVTNTETGESTEYTGPNGFETYRTDGTFGDEVEIKLTAETESGETICQRYTGTADGAANFEHEVCTASAEFVMTDVWVPDEQREDRDFNHTVEIKNIGDESGSVYVMPTAGGHTLDNSGTKLELAPGESATASFNPEIQIPGEYVMGSTVDAADGFEKPTTKILDAAFAATEISAPSSVETGEDVNITVEITNVGETTEDKYVDVEFDNHSRQDLRTDTLEPGESQTFTITKMARKPGDHDIIVDPEPTDDSVGATVSVSGTPIVPEWLVTDYNITETVLEPEERFRITATIKNVGNYPGEAEADIADDVNVGTDIKLGPGESGEVSWDTEFRDPGRYNGSLGYETTESVSYPDIVVIEDRNETEFTVTDFSLSTQELTTSDTLEATVGIKNAGDQNGTVELGLTRDGEIMNGSQTALTLAAGESTTRTLTVSFDEGGEYTIGTSIDLGSGVESKSVTVREPEFVATNLRLVPETAAVSEEYTLKADIENVGDATGTTDVLMTVDGETIEFDPEFFYEDDNGDELYEGDKATVTVAPGESETVSLTFAQKEVGEYEIGTTAALADGATPATLTVEGVPSGVSIDTFDITDTSTEGDYWNPGEAKFDINWNLAPDTAIESATVSVTNLVNGERTEYDGTTGTETYTSEGSDGDKYEIQVKAVTKNGNQFCKRYVGTANGQNDFQQTADCSSAVPGEPLFVTTDMQLQPPVTKPGETVKVRATVKNVGNKTGVAPVDMTVDGDTLNGDPGQNVSLAPGDTRTVRYQLRINGEGDFTVGTTTARADGFQYPTLTLTENPGEAKFETKNVELSSDTVEPGEEVTIKATIRNGGGQKGSTPVALTVGGSPAGPEKSVELEPGQRKTVTFRYAFEQTGAFKVGTDINASQGTTFPTITVSDSGESPFVTSDIQIGSDTVEPGEQVEIEATIKNAGSETTEMPISLTIDGKERTSLNDPVELAPGQRITVTFRYAFAQTGDFTVGTNHEPADGVEFPTVTVKDPGEPAFRTTDVSLSPSEIETGDQFTISMRIKNIGDAAGSTPVMFTVNGDKITDSKQSVSLAAGESEIVTFTSTLDTPGSYEIGSSVTVASGVDLPTLTVTEPAEPTFRTTDVSLSSSEIEVGEELSIEATIENVGDAAGSTPVALTVNGDEITSTEQSISLGAGESQTVTFTRTFDTTGVYDIGTSVTTATDVSLPSVTVTEPAEPAFETTDVTLSASEIEAGEQLTIEATIENVGDAAGSTPVALTVNGDEIASTEQSISLNAGESQTVTFTRTFNSTGTYELGTTVAAADDLTLPDVTVTEPAEAEFVTTDVSLSASEIEVGDNLTISTTIENVGDAAGSTPVTFTLNGSEFTDNEQTVTLDAGQSTTVTFTQTFDLTGTYEIGSSVPLASGVDLPTVTVTETAEPAFETTDVSLSASEIEAGEELTIDAVIANVGNASGTTSVALTVDGEQIASTETEMTLAAGETKAVSFTRTFNSTGTYELGTTVAAADDVALPSVTVTEPAEATFRTTSMELSASEIEVGDKLLINATIENVGEAAGSTSVRLTEDGEEIVTSEQSISLDAGESTTLTFTRIFDNTGSYEFGTTVTLADDVTGPSVTVTEPAEPEFVTTDVSLSASEIEVGEELTIEATIENTGDAAGSTPVALTSNGDTVTSTEQTISLDAGQSKTVTFTRTFENTGSYELGTTVTLADGVSLPSVTVTEPAEPEFRTTAVSLSSSEIETGEELTIDATIENTGDAAGSTSVALTIDDETITGTEQSISLDAGESTTVTFTRTFDSTGSYELGTTVTTAIGVDLPSVTVNEPSSGDAEIETFAVSDESVSGWWSRAELAVDWQVANTDDATVTIFNRDTDTVVAEYSGLSGYETYSDWYQYGDTFEITLTAGDACQRYVGVADGEANFEFEDCSADDPGEPAFETTSIDVAADTIEAGETLEIDATIENVGNASGTTTAALTVDGEKIIATEESVTLDAGESQTLRFTRTFESTGTFELGSTVTLAESVTQPTVTVEEPAEPAFRTTNVALSASEIQTGEQLTIEATIENVGDAAGSTPVALTIDGQAVADTQQSVSLGINESQTVSFTYTFESADTYELGTTVTTAAGVTLPSVTVEQPPEPEFVTTDVTLSESTINVTDDVSVEATIENVGDAAGSTPVALTVNGDEITSSEQSISLDAGESTTVTFTRTFDTAGSFEIGTSVTLADGVTQPTVTVEDNTSDGVEIQTFDVFDDSTSGWWSQAALGVEWEVAGVSDATVTIINLDSDTVVAEYSGLSGYETYSDWYEYGDAFEIRLTAGDTCTSYVGYADGRDNFEQQSCSTSSADATNDDASSLDSAITTQPTAETQSARLALVN